MPLEMIIAGVIASLVLYALLGGADYGGGVWDLFAFGMRAKQQRALIAEAIGPVWEANHVWIILVIVILLTAFPPAFAAIATALHIPITLLAGHHSRRHCFGDDSRRERRNVKAVPRKMIPTSAGASCFRLQASSHPLTTFNHHDLLRRRATHHAPTTARRSDPGRNPALSLLLLPLPNLQA